MNSANSFHVLLLTVLLLAAGTARAELNAGQARKLISRVAGSNLPTSKIRVTRISPVDNGTAEATAQIETAFRLESEQGQWGIREVRIAPDVWEDVRIIGESAGRQMTATHCSGAELKARTPEASEPSVRRVRCLLAELFGVELPSDAVRVKDVSPLTLPLSSKPSAVVEASVRLDFRFTNQSKNGWQVSDIKTSSGPWVGLAGLVARINEEKRKRATETLETMANALARFRSERGHYVASDQQRVLIDHLAPRYLSVVIRVDPWHKPYLYQGELNTFRLSSSGPDGKPNTSDDVVLSRP